VGPVGAVGPAVDYSSRKGECFFAAIHPTPNDRERAEMGYRFVINGQPSETYEEQAIRQLIELRVIGPDTPAWRETMDCWQPACQISDLATLFPGATAAAGPASPPPIPARVARDAGGSEPTREFRGEGAPVPPFPSTAGRPGGLETAALQLVHWFFRPWNGRRSRVADYVGQNPHRAIPVALALVAGMFLLFCIVVSPFVAESGGGQTPVGNSGQFSPMLGQAGGGGFNMQNWRTMQNAQDYSSNVIDDVYKYNRDSFDRRYDTYKDATYDWHHSNSD